MWMGNRRQFALILPAASLLRFNKWAKPRTQLSVLKLRCVPPYDVWQFNGKHISIINTVLDLQDKRLDLRGKHIKFQNCTITGRYDGYGFFVTDNKTHGELINCALLNEKDGVLNTYTHYIIPKRQEERK